MPRKSYIFWNSRDFMETLDAVSRYRFMEVFNIKEFPETVDDMVNLFANAIMESDAGILVSVLGDEKWGQVLYNLWLASRSASLCGRIRNFVEIALIRIANKQLSDGCWPSGDKEKVGKHYMRHIPDNYLTALSCVVILRLSRNNWQLERAREGVQWLAKQQQQNGAWTAGTTEYKKPSRKARGARELVSPPDLLTTLLAAEAVRLSGLDGYDHTLSMAESWITSQQDSEGTWEGPGFPFPFMTVLVVEYFERKWPPLSNLGNYLSIGRDFLMRSRELVLEDSENSRRLSIVVSFQGIEAFLYACLSNPKINIRIFEKPHKTIGMRKSLTEFQTYLQQKKVLKKGQVIPYRNELDSLAYHRDQIVHKGALISEKEAREIVEASVRFSDLMCQRIFGHSLF